MFSPRAGAFDRRWQREEVSTSDAPDKHLELILLIQRSAVSLEYSDLLAINCISRTKFPGVLSLEISDLGLRYFPHRHNGPHSSLFRSSRLTLYPFQTVQYRLAALLSENTHPTFLPSKATKISPNYPHTDIQCAKLFYKQHFFTCSH